MAEGTGNYPLALSVPGCLLCGAGPVCGCGLCTKCCDEVIQAGVRAEIAAAMPRGD